MSVPCHLGYVYRRAADLQDEPPLTTDEIASIRARIAGKVVEESAADSSLPTPCHLWQGCKRFRSEPYGAIKFRGRVWRVHRLVLAIELGRWLGSEEVVLHLCNQPGCVNPAHLQAGSQSENIQQCHDEGRHGELVGLDDDLIGRIEQLVSRGWSSWLIADELFLPRSTVNGYLQRNGLLPRGEEE